MKKILLISCLVFLVASCKKEQKTYYGPGGETGFAQTEMQIEATTENQEMEVPVVYTEYHSPYYQSIQFRIDPASTAQRAVQFELPTAMISGSNPLTFIAEVRGSQDGMSGTFPITLYPDKITEPVVLILNAVNGPDATPVEGCNPQLTIRLNPAQ